VTRIHAIAFRLQREKEERKQAALERSRQRQADASYFAAKVQANLTQSTTSNKTCEAKVSKSFITRRSVSKLNS
jgi:hypothetical protein